MNKVDQRRNFTSQSSGICNLEIDSQINDKGDFASKRPLEYQTLWARDNKKCC
jgi:hypothetical protein